MTKEETAREYVGIAKNHEVYMKAYVQKPEIKHWVAGGSPMNWAPKWVEWGWHQKQDCMANIDPTTTNVKTQAK